MAWECVTSGRVYSYTTTLGSRDDSVLRIRLGVWVDNSSVSAGRAYEDSLKSRGASFTDLPLTESTETRDISGTAGYTGASRTVNVTQNVVTYTLTVRLASCNFVPDAVDDPIPRITLTARALSPTQIAVSYTVRGLTSPNGWRLYAAGRQVASGASNELSGSYLDSGLTPVSYTHLTLPTIPLV